MTSNADKDAVKLRVAISDEESSEEELAEATRKIRQELLELDIDNVEPERGRHVPTKAKVVEPFSLGLLALKLVASGGVLTGVVSVLRSWVQGRTSRTVTVQYGKDKLTLRGASSKQQDKVISEWINRHFQHEAEDSRAKTRGSRKKTTIGKRSARR